MQAPETRRGGRHCLNERGGLISGEAEQSGTPDVAGVPAGPSKAVTPATAPLEESVRWARPCQRELRAWLGGLTLEAFVAEMSAAVRDCD